MGADLPLLVVDSGLRGNFGCRGGHSKCLLGVLVWLLARGSVLFGQVLRDLSHLAQVSLKRLGGLVLLCGAVLWGVQLEGSR